MANSNVLMAKMNLILAKLVAKVVKFKLSMAKSDNILAIINDKMAKTIKSAVKIYFALV